MHLPTLAPQRSVPRAAFLYDHEIFLGSGDFPNVYYRCSLSRAVPISKREEVRASCLPEKRSQRVLVEPPAVLSARHHYTLSNPENPRVACSAYHEMNFTGYAFYWPFAQLFSQNSAVFSMPSSHALSPRPFKLTLWQ